MHDVWLTAKPEWLIWIATHDGVLIKKDRIRFYVWCCKQIWILLKDKISKKAVCVANRYARGKATEKELNAAAYAATAYAAYAAYAAAADAAAAAKKEMQIIILNYGLSILK